MTKPTDAELENRFLYHAGPPSRQAKHAKVSDLCLALSKELRDLMPEGRNHALALTHLEDVRMRANAALACDSPPGE
jgi:hypothetical protein